MIDIIYSKCIKLHRMFKLRNDLIHSLYIDLREYPGIS